jgi:hypothetical protein
VPTPSWGHCIIGPQVNCEPGQAYCYGCLTSIVSHPAIQFSPHVTPGSHTVGRCEIGIELHSLTKLTQGLAVGLVRTAIEARHTAEKLVVSVEALRWFAFGTLYFGLLKSPCDGANDACRNLVPQIEYGFNATIESICPEVCSTRGIDELSRDPDAVAGLAHATLKHVANAQVTPHLLNVDRAVLIGEARMARDHEERTQARKRDDNVFDDGGKRVLPARTFQGRLAIACWDIGVAKEGWATCSSRPSILTSQDPEPASGQVVCQGLRRRVRSERAHRSSEQRDRLGLGAPVLLLTPRGQDGTTTCSAGLTYMYWSHALPAKKALR